MKKSQTSCVAWTMLENRKKHISPGCT